MFKMSAFDRKDMEKHYIIDKKKLNNIIKLFNVDIILQSKSSKKIFHINKANRCQLKKWKKTNFEYVYN